MKNLIYFQYPTEIKDIIKRKINILFASNLIANIKYYLFIIYMLYIVTVILMFAFDINYVQYKSHLIEAIVRYFPITYIILKLPFI